MSRRVSEFNDDKYNDVKETMMAHIVHLVSEENKDMRGTRITVNEKNIGFIGELIQFVFEQGKNNPFIVKSIWQWMGEATRKNYFWQSHHSVLEIQQQQEFATQLLDIIVNNLDHSIAFCKNDDMIKPLDLLKRIFNLSCNKKATVETKNKIGNSLRSICEALLKNTEDKKIIGKINKFFKQKVAPLLPQSAEESGLEAPPAKQRRESRSSSSHRRLSIFPKQPPRIISAEPPHESTEGHNGDMELRISPIPNAHEDARLQIVMPK